MAKDYAKRVFSSTRNSKPKKLRKDLLIFFSLILSCIVGFSGFIFRDSLFIAENSCLVRAKLLFSSAHNAKSVKNKTKLVVPNEVEPTVHFDFYNELPQAKLTLPAKESEVVVKNTHLEKPAIKKDLAYVIRFGQFDDEIKAAQLRLSLLLSNIEADVIKIGSQSGKTFRVQSGPFNDQSQAKLLLGRCQKKGILAVLEKA